MFKKNAAIKADWVMFIGIMIIVPVQKQAQHHKRYVCDHDDANI